MAKMSKKALDARVNKAASRALDGRPVPIMSLSRIFKAGEKVALAGGSDAEIEAACGKEIDAVLAEEAWARV